MGRGRGLPRTAGILLLAIIGFAVSSSQIEYALAALATGGGTSWPSLQGGPMHLAAAPDAPQPALRAEGKSGWPASAVSAVVSIPGLAVADASQSVIGFDPNAARVLWTVPRARGPLDPPAIDPAAGLHGAVIYPEGNGSHATGIVAIDPKTRKRLWRFRLTEPARGAPSVAGSTVYFGSQDDFVYALDAAKGTLEWKTKAIGPVDTSPAVANGRVFVVAESTQSRSARMYALNATDGSKAWTYDTPIAALGSSSPTVARGSVYVGMGDIRVHAFNAETGRLRWTVRTRSVFTPGSSPAYWDGSVYVADDGGGLYRLSASNGAKIWDYQFANLTGNGAPLVAGGVTYLGLQDGSMEAVNASGFQVWTAKVSDGPVGPLTPYGDQILASTQAGGTSKGGVVALRHDPGVALINVISPTKLLPGRAVLNYVVAFAILMAVLLGLFGLVQRRVRAAGDGASADLSRDQDDSAEPSDRMGHEVDA